MARFEELPPSFFVFYSDDFATKLSIPSPVVKEHRDFLCQIIVTLTTESGRSWDVEIEKIDGGYYFTDGWSHFVKDNALVQGKLLLFHIIGHSTLQVSIFGHHSWLEPPNAGYQMVVASSWRFVKKVKTHHIENGRMDMPRHFAEGTGIARSGKMRLQSEDGREWPISVTNRSVGMYSMTRGWVQFVRGNKRKLRIGSILLFQLLPHSDNVVRVVPMGNQAGNHLLSQAKYGGLLHS